MNNTKYYNLTQWEDTDCVERKYFNQDSGYIDNALASLTQGLHSALLSNYYNSGARPEKYGVRYDGFSDSTMLDTSESTMGFSIAEKICVATPRVNSSSNGANGFSKVVQSGITTYNSSIANPGTYLKSIEINMSASVNCTINIQLLQAAKPIKTLSVSDIKSARTLVFSLPDMQALRLTPNTALTFYITATDSATFNLYTGDTGTAPYIKLNYLDAEFGELITTELGNIHRQGSMAMAYVECETNLSKAPEINFSLLSPGNEERPLTVVEKLNPSGNCYCLTLRGAMPDGPIRMKIAVAAGSGEIIQIKSYSIYAF